MPDVSTGEFQGKSTKQKEAIKAYTHALEMSRQFVQSEFQKAVRLYRLFAGNLPVELDGTFSKIMLWFPFSIVDQELPHSARVLSTPNWFNMRANEPFLEPYADAAQKWAHYQMCERQKIARTIVPTLQQQHVYGTGYRFYGHKFLSKKHMKRAHDRAMGMPVNFRDEQVEQVQSIITGQHLDFFNVFPSPSGGLVNDFDHTGENVADYVIAFTYPTQDWLKTMANQGVFDKQQVTAMFDGQRANTGDPSMEWKQQLWTADSGWSNFSTPQWISQMQGKNVDLTKRNRVGWLFQRDKWRIIGEDMYVLYDGPPLIDAIPIAKFTGTHNMARWFGIGLIEPVEDLIISMIMNFNHRMDYLAGTLHPPMFVPQDLLEELGGDKSAFDPDPYTVTPYDASAYPQGIDRAVWRDRFPDISQQAFFEEGKMQEFVQEITGQPNLGKGISAGQNAGDIGATGIVSLIDSGAARQMMRAINSEQSGLLESLRLTMMFGEKYVTDDTKIRISGEGGMPWHKVPHEAIVDGYGIEITGTRAMNQAQETFKRMISTVPYLLNNPNVRNQVEVLRQLMEKSDGWDRIDEILGEPRGGAPIMTQEGGATQPGGSASAQNDARSTMNRNTVQPQTGNTVAAGNILV